MKDKITNIIANKYVIIILLSLMTIGACVQLLNTPTFTHPEYKRTYTEYNNYMIFKYSFKHLVNNQNLYTTHFSEHLDAFKYTPTFAVFFGAFSIMPDWAGLILWNLLNTLVLTFSIYYLPRFNLYQKGLILLICSNEIFTSVQNAQANVLMAGLIIFAYGLLENKKYIVASLLIVLSAYIKLFGIVGFALFLFYPDKLKLALYSAFWTIALFLVPLTCINISEYATQTDNYFYLLNYDHSSSYGISLMGIINSWFNIDFNKNLVVLAGVITFLVSVFRFKLYNNFKYKLLTLSSILLWVVIFNHKAESPTFIIAFTGVAIWFIQGEKTKLNIVLFISALLFTSLSPTDIFPPAIRKGFFEPYAIKALPCILIWGKLLFDMMTLKNSESNLSDSSLPHSASDA